MIHLHQSAAILNKQAYKHSSFFFLHFMNSRLWQIWENKQFWRFVLSDRKKKQQYQHSVLNCAINNVFHLFYRSAKMTPPATVSPPLLHSVQITSVLSLHSFIFLSWAQIVSCCLSSCSFIKEAGTQCQQAAPSHPLVLCHVAEDCWLGEFFLCWNSH